MLVGLPGRVCARQCVGCCPSRTLSESVQQQCREVSLAPVRYDALSGLMSKIYKDAAAALDGVSLDTHARASYGASRTAKIERGPWAARTSSPRATAAPSFHVRAVKCALNEVRTPARRGGSHVDETRRSCSPCTATWLRYASYGRAVGASQLLLSSRAMR